MFIDTKYEMDITSTVLCWCHPYLTSVYVITNLNIITNVDIDIRFHVYLHKLEIIFSVRNIAAVHAIMGLNMDYITQTGSPRTFRRVCAQSRHFSHSCTLVQSHRIN